MNLSHSQSPFWGKRYRLRRWAGGVTLDWGRHRFILSFGRGA